jgi:hypothetical protein
VASERFIAWRARPTLTPREVSRITGLHIKDVSALITDGTLGHIAVRGNVLVYTGDVIRIFDKPCKGGDLRVASEADRLHKKLRSM